MALLAEPVSLPAFVSNFQATITEFAKNLGTTGEGFIRNHGNFQLGASLLGLKWQLEACARAASNITTEHGQLYFACTLITVQSGLDHAASQLRDVEGPGFLKQAADALIEMKASAQGILDKYKEHGIDPMEKRR